MTSASTAYSLEFLVNHSGAPAGRFPTGGGCIGAPAGNLSAGASATNVDIGWANSTTPFTGPGNFVTCNFIATAPPATLDPGDFVVSVLDCSGNTAVPTPGPCSPPAAISVSVGACTPVAAVCGNGVKEGGEECDGGATCTSHCVLKPNGCTAAPLTGCRTGLAGGSKILIKNNLGDNTKDQGQYQWKKGAATTVDDFADPVNGSATYSWCVYDNNGLVGGETVAAGTGWAASGTTGFKFKSATDASGVSGITLKAGDTDKASVSLKAKDKEGDYKAPSTPLVTPVKSQFVINDGGQKLCFETIFTAPAKNDASQFNSKGP